MEKIKVFEFTSKSNPDKVYKTTLYTDGTTSCQCRGWTTLKNEVRVCTHTKQVASSTEGALAETLVGTRAVSSPERAGHPPVSRSVKAEASENRAIERAKDALSEKVIGEKVMKMFDDKANGFRDIEVMKAGTMTKEELDKIWDNPRWIAEEKLNGARYTLHLSEGGIRVFSRWLSKLDGLRIERTNNVPHIRDLAVRELEGTIIDGEMVVEGVTKSNRVMKVMGAHPEVAVSVQKKEGWVIYKIFDVIQYKGKSVENEPCEKRREIITEIISVLNSQFIKRPDFVMEKKKEFFDKIIKAKGEGIILKDLDGVYKEGVKSRQWIKVKDEKHFNVICVGYTKGKNAFASTFGALEFGIYIKGKLEKVGKCSGLTLAMRNDIHENRDKYLGMVFEVKGDSITDYGKVLSPQFREWREEINPKECTLEYEVTSG